MAKANPEVVAQLARLTLAWHERRFDELEDILHQRVVFVPPGMNKRIVGRAACISSYRQFMDAARVLAYEETRPVVETWGDTATAHYRWRMEWQTASSKHEGEGHDVFTLLREKGRWWVVWRLMIPAAPSG